MWVLPVPWESKYVKQKLLGEIWFFEILKYYYESYMTCLCPIKENSHIVAVQEGC